MASPIVCQQRRHRDTGLREVQNRKGFAGLGRKETGNVIMNQYEKQVAADRVHHQERLDWLSGDSPKWACGKLLTQVEICNLKRDSERCLADPTGMHGYNSAEKVD